MDIEEFEDWLSGKPEAFIIHYKRHHNDFPSDWPMNMSGADWMEQFIVWLEAETEA